MSYSQQRHVLVELCAEGRLDDAVRLIICHTTTTCQYPARATLANETEALTDGGRRLVEDQELAPPDDGAREREDLPLADGQVRTAARDLAVERDARVVALVLQVEEACGAERVVEHRVVVLREGVEVLAERSAEKLGLPRSATK